MDNAARYGLLKVGIAGGAAADQQAWGAGIREGGSGYVLAADRVLQSVRLQ